MTTPLACPACFAGLSPEARYCHRCGRAVPVGGSSERTSWIIAWSLVLLAIGGIVYFVLAQNTAQSRPDMANVGAEASGTPVAAPGGGVPPDISQMTPRQRFLRLNDRIARAAQQGDTVMAQRFAPMAISAYGMLDSYDPDVQYHAGSVHIQLHEYPAALALADTIQREVKDHLFADMLRTEVAQAKGDQAALTKGRKAFLQHYDAQIATGRSEYQEHRSMLDEFKSQVRQ
jgi:hypothetical protein